MTAWFGFAAGDGRSRAELWLRGRPRSLRGDHGATAVEYALMAALVVLVIVGAVTFFGQSVSALFIVPAGTF